MSNPNPKPILNLPDTRVSLLVRLQDSKNEQAWHEFVGIYEPLVFNVARRTGLQEADARDVTQQTLMAVHRHIPTWDSNRTGSFRGWLSRIARNLAINLLIQHGRHTRGTGDSEIRKLLEQKPDPNASETIEFDLQYRRQLFQNAAQVVCARVEQPTWCAFWETCIVGRSISEVAADLKMTVGAIYVSRSRVMTRLRKYVESLEKQFEL